MAFTFLALFSIESEIIMRQIQNMNCDNVLWGSDENKIIRYMAWVFFLYFNVRLQDGSHLPQADPVPQADHVLSTLDM